MVPVQARIGQRGVAEGLYSLGTLGTLTVARVGSASLTWLFWAPSTRAPMGIPWPQVSSHGSPLPCLLEPALRGER